MHFPFKHIIGILRKNLNREAENTTRWYGCVDLERLFSGKKID